ncbi:MAG: DUF5107 domain-containing protein [Candidatus Aminicenantaceae bacterium]
MRKVTVGILFLLAAWAAAGYGGRFVKKQNIIIKEQEITIPTYPIGNDNPYPFFTSMYPYPYKGEQTVKKVNRKYTKLVLENKYLSISVLPDLGGHLYNLYDKITKREVIYTNHVIKPGYFGGRGGWCSGGFEFNFPHAHTYLSINPVNYDLRKNSDGSGSIIIGAIDRLYGMWWQVTLTLYPDKYYLEQKVRYANRTLLPHRHQFWTIVATHAHEDCQVFQPIRRIVDNNYKQLLSWPIQEGKDVSWWKNLPSNMSWFRYQPTGGYWCFYEHNHQAGMVHYADLHLIPGGKWYAAGPQNSGIWHQSFVISDEDGPYTELDSSPEFTQSDYRILKPLEARHWTEYWFPVNKLEGIVKANRDAALNVMRKNGKITVKLNTNFVLDNSQIEVKVGNKPIKKQIVFSVPGGVFSLETKDKPGIISVLLTDAKGKKVISYTEEVIEESELPPVGPLPQPETETDKMTSQQTYNYGIYSLEQEKMMEAKRYFEAAIGKQPDLSPAHTQLGIIYLKQGLWNEAEKEFNLAIPKAFSRDGSPYFYLGNLHKLRGEEEEAIKNFIQATKFGETYAEAFHSLAQLTLAKGEYESAMDYFNRALERNALSGTTQVLKAVVYRKMGDKEKAKKIISKLLLEEPVNLFARVEKSFINALDVESTILNIDLQQGANPIHSYLYIARDYMNSGLYKEAVRLLETIVEQTNQQCYPMVFYYLGYCLKKLGAVEKARLFYQMASKVKDCRYLFPNNVKDFIVLDDVLKEFPHNGLAHYALGTLLASRFRTDEAIKHFETAIDRMKNSGAAQIPAKDHLIAVTYRNIGYLLEKFKEKPEKAIPYYQQSIKYKSNHSQVYFELAHLYRQLESTGEAISILEEGLEKATNNISVLTKLLTDLYLGKKEYNKVLKIIDKYGSRTDHWHRYFYLMPSYRKVQMEKGKQYFQQKKYEKALAEFEEGLIYPESLRFGKDIYPVFALLHWWRGLAYKQMNEPFKAKECWRSAISERHGPTSIARLYQAKCLKRLGREKEFEEVVKEVLAACKAAIPGVGEEEFRRSYFANLNYIEALILEERGQIEEAMEKLKKALKYQPTWSEPKEKLEELKKKNLQE